MLASLNLLFVFFRESEAKSKFEGPGTDIATRSNIYSNIYTQIYQ